MFIVAENLVCRPEIGPKHFDKLKPEPGQTQENLPHLQLWRVHPPDRSRMSTIILFAASLTDIPGLIEASQKNDEESKHRPNEYFDPGSWILNHAPKDIPDSV